MGTRALPSESGLFRVVLLGLITQLTACIAGSPCDGRFVNENEADACGPGCGVRASREAPGMPCPYSARVPVIWCVRPTGVGTENSACVSDPATGYRYYTMLDYGLGDDTGLVYCTPYGEPNCP